MLTRTFSGALAGVDAVAVEVELNATGRGEESIVAIVGLPDTAIKESRDRIKSALFSCGYGHPQGHTLVNLAPADMKKEGAAFDLPIALSLIAANGIVPRENLASAMILGELALDGSVRPVKGALPIALLARKLAPQIRTLILPAENAPEGAVAVDKVRVFAVSCLQEAVAAVNGELMPVQPDADGVFAEPDWSQISDFADVKGQFQAKRALEIAAAGGHNVLFVGPPGTGKSMLAKRLPGILPPMTEEETLDTSRVYSVLGLLDSKHPLLRCRPFRAPHHTVSDAGLLGGGTNPQPGEISLAHNGVLFLDELPEFKRSVLETLRQPIESGVVTISRASGSFDFPCEFILLAAMNPCPCGHYGDRLHVCRCGQKRIQDYRAKISGPLMDRIDLHVEVSSLTENELLNAPDGETSAQIRARVIRAREIQNRRFAGNPRVRCNARMESAEIRRFCEITADAKTQLRHTITEFGLSARAYDRILRVARTVADLDGAEQIASDHIFEAINYRSLDRRL